jgi:hypothetical protein
MQVIDFSIWFLNQSKVFIACVAKLLLPKIENYTIASLHANSREVKAVRANFDVLECLS